MICFEIIKAQVVEEKPAYYKKNNSCFFW